MPDQSPPITLPMTLRPSLLRGLLLIAVSAVMLVVAFFVISQNPVIGWIGAVFFGLGLIIFVLQLLPGSTSLELTSDGFTMTSLFRRHFRRWSDIDEVRVIRIGRRKGVGFRYRPDYDGKVTLRRLNRATSGVDGALPVTYGMKAKDLTDLMTEIKRRADHGQL
jgi:hypothetical protein